MKAWEVKKALIEKIRNAEVIEHPDTVNTFAAYQIIIDGLELWGNSRDEDCKIFHAGRLINRA